MESPPSDPEFEPLLVDDFDTLYHGITCLRSLSIDLVQFHEDSLKTRSERSVDAFETIRATLDSLELLCRELSPHAKRYDFSEDVKGNGYRSLLKVCDRCVCKLVRLARKCWKNKKNKVFTAAATLNDVASYADVLCGLKKLLNLAIVMVECSQPEHGIFPVEEQLPLDAVHRMEKMTRTEFYGTCLGFQYASSVRPLLRTIGVAMAAYGEGYRKHNREGCDGTSFKVAAASLANSFKYMTNPKKRAEMIVDLTTNCDINFAKAFWSLTEKTLLKHYPKLVCSSLAINQTFDLPTEPVYLPHVKNGSEVMIQPPLNEAAEPQPVHVRLLLYKKHSQLDSKKQFSDKLLIHFHGGGFVAQSSKSHECYLRNWARDLDSPILSVDYSLSPEYPFPRGLDDVFFAYTWALANPECLHTTARHICITGDSAGANLTVAMTLKAIEKGIRIPDGIVPIYGAYLVRYSLSPSRLLSVMDPFLLQGILVKCLAAYAGESHEDSPHTSTSVDPDKVIDSLFPSSEHTSETIDGLIDVVGSARYDNSLFRKYKSEPTLLSPRSSPLRDDSSVDSADSFVVFKRPDVNELKMDETQIEREPLNKSKAMTSDSVHPMDQARSDSKLKRFVQASAVVAEEKWSRFKSFFTGSQGTDPPDSQETVRKPTHRKEKMPPREPTMDLFTGKHPPQTSSPFMSPYLAEESLLACLPRTHLVASHLDPLLDDSVAFAHRLRSFGVPVTLDLVDNVPHGFLNLSLNSKEARRGCETCLSRISQVLDGRGKAKKKKRGVARLQEETREGVQPSRSSSTSVDGDESLVNGK